MYTGHATARHRETGKVIASRVFEADTPERLQRKLQLWILQKDSDGYDFIAVEMHRS
jgi:hypothetical protein